MKRFLVVVVAVVMTSGMLVAADRNLSFQFGQKSLDSDDWGKLDKHLLFGAHYDMALGTMPFNLAFDLLLTTGTEEDRIGGVNVDLTGSTTELSVGARKYFGTKPLFYAGAGLDYIMAKMEVEGGGFSSDESDSGIGFFAGGGALFPIGTDFNMGLDLRYSSAKADEVAAGGLCYSLVLGMGF